MFSEGKIFRKPQTELEEGIATEHKQRSVAITFDDGPVEPYTSQVLDILMKYNVLATFFLLGENIERFPDTAQRIVNEGHRIGNHTHDHSNLAEVDNGRVDIEVAKGAETLKTILNQEPTIFRPPYGEYTPYLFEAIDKFGYRVVLWSIDPVDWDVEQPEIDNQVIFDKVEPGSIILLHDGIESHATIPFDRANTVDMLPLILEELIKRGYKFSTTFE